MIESDAKSRKISESVTEERENRDRTTRALTRKSKKIFSSTANGSGATGSTTRCSVTNRAEYPMGNNQAGRGQFAEFANNAQIGPFGPALFHAPKRKESYNDDVVLPLYGRYLRSYDGAQRKGIRDERPTATNAPDHVMGAPKPPFFLAQSTPIPPSADNAVEFLATSCRRDVSAFWKKQLGRLEHASDAQRGVAPSWDACRHKEPRPHRAANAPMLGVLMRRFKLGGGGGRRRVKKLVLDSQ